MCSGMLPDMSTDTGRNVRTPPDDWLSVADAARLVGVKPDAMRKRAARGAVVAVKSEGEWRIDPDSLGRHVRTEPDTGGTEPATNVVVELDMLRKLVESHEKHIDTLTRELEALHVHLDRLTRALPRPEEEDEGTRSKTRRPRWWPFAF